MYRLKTNRILGATALLSVFLLFFLSREAHYNYDHDHVHQKCAAQGATRHLHSPEYGLQDCLLYHLNFQEYFEVYAAEMTLHPPVSSRRDNFRYSIAPKPQPFTAFQQRGPPSFPYGG